MNLVKGARLYARRAHEGQYRRGGEPFFNHCERVARKVWALCPTKIAVVSAYLHDCVEDNRAHPADIHDYFGKDVYDIVMILSKRKGESYEDYIERIIESDNLIAMQIKLADNEDNIARCAFGTFPEKVRQRLLRRWNWSKRRLLMILSE